jgi:hypothetical protein
MKLPRQKPSSVEIFHKTIVDQRKSATVGVGAPEAVSSQPAASHPLGLLCYFSKLGRKDLARELGVPDTLVGDCLREKSSLRFSAVANRRLIEVFGIRPDSTWSGDKMPLTLLMEPFDSVCYYAWRATPIEATHTGPFVFALARRALLARVKACRYFDYRTTFLGNFAEDSIRAFPALKDASPAEADKYNNFLRPIEKDLRQKDPVLKLPLAEVFKHFPSTISPPTSAEILAATKSFGLRALEEFFPSCEKIQVERHIL